MSKAHISKKRIRWRRKLLRYRQMFQGYTMYILAIVMASILLPVFIYSRYGFKIYAILFVFSFIAILYLAFTKKTIIDKFSWFVLISALPFFGAFLFWLIGTTQLTPKTFRKKIEKDKEYRKRYKEQITIDIPYERRQVKHLGENASYSEENDFELLTGQAVYDQMLLDISNAQHHIHIEMYISRYDETTKPLFEMLKEKARRGVEVRFLGDVVGHMLLRDKVIESLIHAGVEFVFFSQKRGRYFDHFHVNHRKLVIVDGQVAYTGGYNFGSEYVHGYPKKKLKWYDAMFRIKGTCINGMQLNFLMDWCFSTDELILEDPETKTKYFPQKMGSERIKNTHAFTQVLSDGPDCDETEIKEMLRHLIVNSKSHIYLTTPYLIPSDDVLNDLKLAAYSGVDVRIVIPDVPDKKLVYICSESYIEPLLTAGIRIYKMKEHFIHSKLYVFDDSVSMFGTVNFDMRSFFLNFEQNVIQFHDKELNREMTTTIYELLNRSEEIYLNKWRNRSIWKKATELIFRIFAPLL